jgi:transcriptional regulator with GAF, ATPase, and Fis domain
VDENAFRRDLYARLSSFELHLPALRARRQDILGWLDLFCERWSKERGRPVALQLRPVVAEQIVLHSWPDNLRGLERLVQRTLSLDPDATLGVRVLAEVMPELQVHARDADGSLVPPAMPAGRVSSKPAAAADKPSREEFLAVYEATGRSIRATSKHFGRDRRQVYRWLEQFGVER